MRGTISHLLRSEGGFFFITDDDGNQYYGHKKYLFDEKLYRKFCYKGNGVTFLVKEPETPDKHPIAYNIIPDNVPLQPKPNPKTEENRRINEIQKADKERRKEMTKYLIQYRRNNMWMTWIGEGAIYYDDPNTAKECIKNVLQKKYLDQMFRVVKVYEQGGKSYELYKAKNARR